MTGATSGGGFTPHDDIRFVESVKRLREEKGWSQGELARRIEAAGIDGFYQTTVSRIEKGERPVRLGEARALAQVLGSSIERMVAPEPREAYIDAVEHLFWVIFEDAEKIESLVRDIAWNHQKMPSAVDALREVADWADPGAAERAAKQLRRADEYFSQPLEEQLCALISKAIDKVKEQRDGVGQEAP